MKAVYRIVEHAAKRVSCSAQKDLEAMQDQEFGQILRRTNFNIWSRSVIGLTFATGYLISFLWGVAGISSGAITFGVMTAFLQLVMQVQGPLVNLTRQIPSLIYTWKSSGAGYAREL